MHFDALTIDGAVVVSIDRLTDHRGFFARTYCAQEFEALGLPAAFVQSSVSFNETRGTLRGMHFQRPPSNESKLVRCTRGRVYDVLLDLRPASATYLMHEAIVLDSEERNAVYVPAGVAHGFQTLEDKTQIEYQMTDFYAPTLSAGFRWNDVAFGIDWPLPVAVISEQDSNCEDFNRLQFEHELRQRDVQTSKSHGINAKE